MKQKQRVGRYPQEFRQKAVERVRCGESVRAVAQDLGVYKSLIYKWRAAGEQGKASHGEPVDTYRALRQELQEAKQALAEKELEVRFFKGALQKIEARRQPNHAAGKQAFSPRSGS